MSSLTLSEFDPSSSPKSVACQWLDVPYQYGYQWERLRILRDLCLLTSKLVQNNIKLTIYKKKTIYHLSWLRSFFFINICLYIGDIVDFFSSYCTLINRDSLLKLRNNSTENRNLTLVFSYIDFVFQVSFNISVGFQLHL